jgi:hypothetical protein
MPSRPAGNGLAATRDAPLLTMDDRLRAIEATGQRLAGYVQFMCQIGSLSGTSGEAKDRAVTAFYERLLAAEKQLVRIQENLRLE